ncbi:MAG: aminotransferase [Phycisphaerae bacterium]|nr:aminotransferase [Phycisphaerae bacterium]MBM92151.1 aminotransferase [Phycisphaerae bacterium]HCT45754.1 aminotransferase [Phycisphaerales bacterium]
MTNPHLPAPASHASQFMLDPDIVYLNHGSFGACPRSVIDAQQAHRDRIEADAMRFYIYDLWKGIDRSRSALGELINADAEDLVFVSNATSAVATVIANIDLKPGDEIIVNRFEYPACINNLRRACEQSGAKLVVADLPWDPTDEDSAIDAIMSKVTDRTRLVMFSLITSATAVRLPVERLIQELSAKGVETLLDAAHGPGCVAMDIKAWAPTYCTGNAHKWLCAPKGCAFLYVRRDKQDGFRPLVLSNDAYDLEPAIERSGRSAFNHEFDYMGTDDRTAIMTVADAIGALGSFFDGGIDELMRRNRAMCLEARDLLCDAFGTKPMVPDSMLGPLAVVDIPAPGLNPRELRERLMSAYRIEAMIVPNPGGDTPMIRVSPQVYNSMEQYRYAADAIGAIIGL